MSDEEGLEIAELGKLATVFLGIVESHLTFYFLQQKLQFWMVTQVQSCFKMPQGEILTRPDDEGVVLVASAGADDFPEAWHEGGSSGSLLIDLGQRAVI